MKIIIAGDGKVGTTLARQLSAEGYDLTLIDSNPNVMDAIVEKYDVIGVTGNCATQKTLETAGIHEAELLIAATGADEINLLCCMTAHAMNPKLHTIARIRNPEYSDQIYNMRDLLGLSLTVNPERRAAQEIEKLLRLPGFLHRDSFAKGRVEIVELRVDPESKLNHVSLSNLDSIVKCKVLVCTVVRNGEAIMPRGSFTFQEDDRIYVTAPTSELAVLLKNLGILTRKVSCVMLAGGGRITYYLAEQLQKSNIDVRILEKDENRCMELAGLLPNASVIHCDASNETALDSAGLKGCDALVSLTGIDEMNMIISLYATSMGVPQVITKLGHIESSHVLNNLSIGSLVFPKELCCNTIVRYVRALQNQTGAVVSLHSIAGGQAEAIEFTVDDKTLYCDIPLRDIRLQKDVLIVSILHDGQTEIPNGNSKFVAGDTIIIVVRAGRVIHQINEIFS
jgi:trk system potassium uptake protein TrkA